MMMGRAPRVPGTTGGERMGQVSRWRALGRPIGVGLGDARSGPRRWTGAGAVAIGLGLVVAAGTPSGGAGANGPGASAAVSAAPRNPTGYSCATTPDAPHKGTKLTASASSGGVRATLTGTASVTYGLPTLRGAVLTITGPGAATTTQPVSAPKQAGDVDLESLADYESSNPTKPLCVARFGGNPAPTVLLGFYTGGAHCCTIVRAYTRSAAGWTTVDESIGDPGVVLTDLNRQPALVTADDAFSYEFTDYAASGDPVEVLTFSHGAFSNVTRQFPALIRSDATRWWTAFRQSPQDDLGVLAAWAADRCELGQQSEVTTTLASLQARHKLGINQTVAQSGPFWPSGSGYVTALDAFLVQHGYCPPPA